VGTSTIIRKRPATEGDARAGYPRPRGGYPRWRAIIGSGSSPRLEQSVAKLPPVIEDFDVDALADAADLSAR
jgi:hypothetical protein